MAFKLFIKPEVIAVGPDGSIVISKKTLTKYNLLDHKFVKLYYDYHGGPRSCDSLDNAVGIVFIKEEDEHSYPITESIVNDTKFIIDGKDFFKCNYPSATMKEYKFKFTNFENKPMLSFKMRDDLPNS